jgi:flagellar assembly protein FliH
MSETTRASLGGLGPSGFRSDARFAPPAETRAPTPPVHEPEDPLAVAFAEGYAAGAAEAQANAEYLANELAAAREALGLSFARLDKELEEELRLRLRDTVAALCEAAIAPLALDPDALLTRIQRAVAMLARADDDRVIRLHPDDLSLVSPRLAAEWEVLPDPTLERGALRVETSSGGVEDGPEQWRLAIAEALHQC